MPINDVSTAYRVSFAATTTPAQADPEATSIRTPRAELTGGFSTHLRQRFGSDGPSATAAGGVEGELQATPDAEPSPLVTALRDAAASIGDDESALDDAQARLVSGRGLDREELLRLQATAYRYSQRVEVATRVIDRCASGVRQLLNTQL